jgi:hypothetical protein
MRIATWTDWQYCTEEVQANRLAEILHRPEEFAYNTATDSFHPRDHFGGNSGPSQPGEPCREIYAPASAVEAAA